MEKCPVCKAPLSDPAAKECPKCGVVFEKWQAKVAAAVVALQRTSLGERKRRPPHLALFFLVLLAVIVLLIFLSLGKTKGRSGDGTKVTPSMERIPQAGDPAPSDPAPVEPTQVP